MSAATWAIWAASQPCRSRCMPGRTHSRLRCRRYRSRCLEIRDKKRSPLWGDLCSRRRGGLKAGAKLRGFVFQLLILFLLDLNRNLASSKLRRKRHMDLKNPMFIAGGNLVSFDALRQSYRPFKFAVRSLLITFFFLF